MFAEQRRFRFLIVGMVILFAIMVGLSAAVFNVRYDYTLIMVAAGGAVLGLVTGALGSFAVLRRQSLMGDALSHAALPGVSIAFLVAGRDLGWLLLGAGVASWLGVALISAITRTTRIKQDAAMGMVLASFFAFGVALLSYIQGRPDASQAGLDKFIFGQAAAIAESDVWLMSGAGVVAFIIVALFWKEFKLVTFDAEFARANGFRVGLIDALLSTLVVVAIVLGLKMAGVILMVGMLIAPAVAARQWTDDLFQMAVLSGVFGAFAGAAGAIISAADVNIPTGPLMIVVAAALVVVSLLAAPGRGLLWQLWRQRRERQQVARRQALPEGAMD